MQVNDVILTPEEYRKREFWEVCSSKEELYLHIKMFLNIDLPRYNVDELSTSNPLEFMWSIYNTMLTNSGDFRHVVAVNRNGMKCIEKTTLIATPSGPVEIQNLKIGDTVYDEHAKEIKVIGVWDQGIQECVHLTWGGKIWATCTEEHPWLTRGKWRQQGGFIEKYEVKKVKDFNFRDRVVRKELALPLGNTHDPYAYALGAFLGDGCSTECGLRISSANELIPEKVAGLLNTTYLKLRSNNFSYIIHSQRPGVKYIFSDFYEQHIRNKKAHEKTVDWSAIYSWDRETLLNFVAGIIDTDGSVNVGKAFNKNTLCISLGMQAEQVVRAVQYAVFVLWQYESTITCKNRWGANPDYAYKNGPLFKFTINNNNICKRIIKELDPYLVTPSKKWKLEYELFTERNFKHDGLGFKVIPAGKYHCYDITVDSPTSLYCLQNGLVTHNTLCSAILHFYGMLHFRRDCCQLAATKTQSQACIKYLDKFLMIPEVVDYADINNKEEKILNNLPPNSFTDKKDCKIVVMVATLKGTNSARGSLMISDEIDLLDPDIMSEAANVADPTMKEGFDPVSVYLSSRKFSGGPLQSLIDDAENPEVKGIRLHKWSLGDFMQKCPTALHQPEKPKIPALIHRDTLEIIWGEAAAELENKSNYIEVLAYHGCRTCGAFVACQARATKQTGTSPSLRTANFVAGRLRDVKDTKKIISQILNWKPESSGLVFPMFSPHLHVKESKAAYRWITRGEDFNPMNLTEEAYEKCLASENPDDKKLVTPSKRDLYKVLKERGWKIHWGIDWGYTDPAALVIVAYSRKEQRAFVLHSELKTGYSNQDWALYCVNTYGKAFAPDLICPDMADAAAPTYFAKHYLPTRDVKPARIETGVSQVRSLLWNVATQEVNFCILDDRLSVDMIEEFQKWTHERTQTGYNFEKYDKDHFNHAQDSLRYGLDPFVSESEIHFAANNRKEVSTEDLFEAARDPNNLDAQIALAKKQMSDHFLREHGIADLTPKFNIPFAIPLAQASPSFTLNQERIASEKENRRGGGIFFKFG